MSTSAASPKVGAAKGSQLPDTFFLIRRRGSEDDDWQIVTDPGVAARHSQVHFQVERCQPAPLPVRTNPPPPDVPLDQTMAPIDYEGRPEPSRATPRAALAIGAPMPADQILHRCHRADLAAHAAASQAAFAEKDRRIEELEGELRALEFERDLTETAREAAEIEAGKAATSELQSEGEKRDYTLVTLPMCASESGVPMAGVLGGYLANEYTHDREAIVRSALSQFRRGCIEHHGRDLLPDADDPDDSNWFVLCVDKEHAVYEMYFKGSSPKLASTQPRAPQGGKG